MKNLAKYFFLPTGKKKFLYVTLELLIPKGHTWIKSKDKNSYPMQIINTKRNENSTDESRKPGQNIELTHLFSQ